MLSLDQLTDQRQFTLTEKRIADYILEHLTDIPTIYIEDLAKLTYTSHSAIIRLCKKLHYSGFREFKTDVSRLVHTQLHTLSEVDVNFPFTQEDSPMSIAKKMADLSIDAIQKTLVQLDDELLSKVLQQINCAERVFLFAQGDSQIRARSFQNKLVKLNKFFILAEQYADEYWHAANLTTKDCGIIISYSGRVPQYEQIMTHFKQELIPTILLTGNPQSSLVPLATQTIFTIQEEYDFAKVATFSSQVAFEYILDTLFSLIYAQDYRTNVLNLKSKQGLLQDGLLSDHYLTDKKETDQH